MGEVISGFSSLANISIKITISTSLSVNPLTGRCLVGGRVGRQEDKNFLLTKRDDLDDK